MVDKEKDGYVLMVNTEMDPLNIYDHVSYLKITANDTRIILIMKGHCRMFERSEDDSLKYISKNQDRSGGMCYLEKKKLLVNYGSHIECGDLEVFDLKTLSIRVVFRAHKHKLAAICGDSKADLVATASERGTVIRVFIASTGYHFCDFRSSYIGGSVKSLAISSDCGIVACVYSDGLVNVFKLPTFSEQQAEKSMIVSTLSSLFSDYPLFCEYMDQLAVSYWFYTEPDVTAVDVSKWKDDVVMELVMKNRRKKLYKINFRNAKIFSVDEF